MRKDAVLMKIVVVAIVIFALTSVALSVGAAAEVNHLSVDGAWVLKETIKDPMVIAETGTIPTTSMVIPAETPPNYFNFRGGIDDSSAYFNWSWESANRNSKGDVIETFCTGQVHEQSTWTIPPSTLVPGQTMKTDLEASFTTSQDVIQSHPSCYSSIGGHCIRFSITGFRGAPIGPVGPCVGGYRNELGKKSSETIEWSVPQGIPGDTLEIRICPFSTGMGRSDNAIHFIYEYKEESSTTTPAWCDYFDSTTLDPRWSWVREDPTHWSLTEHLGYLRITTQRGDLYQTNNDGKNLLLTPAPSGDFEVTTCVTINPSTNWQSARLFIYQDDDNHFELQRTPLGGQEVHFTKEEKGSSESHSVSCDLTTVYLKITKQNSTYTGYWSTDGSSWTKVYQYKDIKFSNLKIGFSAYNGRSSAPEIPADFDYICVAPIGAVPTPTPTPSPTQQLKISDLRGTLNTDNDCNLYVADYGNNQVKMINPNGSVTSYASGIDRPRYQVFDSAGNLYVGSFDGNIYNVLASGEKTVVAGGIWSLQGMGFDSAGNLYVAGGYDGKIHCIAPDGSKTTMDSGFAHPKHLAVYSNGNIYVVDSNGTLIVRITPEGGKASLVDLGETILGMATDGEYLYVSHSDKISRIDTFGQVTQIATDLDQPSSLTVCNGSVFVTVSDGIVKLKISDETKTGTCDWTGAWETDWGRMELQQNGNKVNGTYTHDQGRIQGTVSGRNLTGTWSEYPSYSPPGDAGDIVFIISADCSSFDGKWRYGTSGGWSGSWTGARKSTGSGTSYPEATLTHSGFDFSEGTTGESPIRDGEVIYWQPGAGTHPDYPDYSGYLWWRNTHLDDVNHASQTKDMGAVDIATVRAVPAEWDKSPLIPPLLMGHTIVAKCYDGYVKFQVISVDPADESARVKYSYSPDTTFAEGTPTLQPTP